MLDTPSIREFSTDIPNLYAFHIDGEVTDDDMEEMAERMNAVFDEPGQVDMLLSFHNFEGSELGAGLDWEVLKSRFRAVTEVRYYVTAGAPKAAENMIAFFGSILPVETHSFDTEDQALDWLHDQSVRDVA